MQPSEKKLICLLMKAEAVKMARDRFKGSIREGSDRV